jgi:hypothetical protein
MRNRFSRIYREARDQKGLCRRMGNWVSNFLQTILRPSTEATFASNGKYIVIPHQHPCHISSQIGKLNFQKILQFCYGILSPSGCVESCNKGRVSRAVTGFLHRRMPDNATLPVKKSVDATSPLLCSLYLYRSLLGNGKCLVESWGTLQGDYSCFCSCCKGSVK